VVVAVHQPEYFPSIRYYHKMAQSDAWIYLSGHGIMFDRSSHQHRCRLRARWLTIPYQHTGELQPLRDVIFADRNWPERHWETLKALYGRDPHWDDLVARVLKGSTGFLPWIQTYIHTGGSNVSAVGVGATAALKDGGVIRGMKYVGADVDLIPQDAVPERTARLVQLVQAVGGTVYLSGQAGAYYLDRTQFDVAGIKLRIHSYINPIDGPELSILDTIARFGIERTRRWIDNA
jgi:hypothetical protein